MAVGKKIVIVISEISSGLSAGTPVLDSMDFTGSFSYNGSYTSNVSVKKDDIAGINYDRFIVTYFYAATEDPDLSTATVDDLVSDAITQINTAFPGSITV